MLSSKKQFKALVSGGTFVYQNQMYIKVDPTSENICMLPGPHWYAVAIKTGKLVWFGDKLEEDDCEL